MTEEIKKKKVKLSPHLAITHLEAQGGASNGRNVSLLMKSVDITDEQKEILKSIVGETEINKMFSNDKRELLDRALKEKFQTEDDGDNTWSWVWAENFDESTVIMSNSDGLYSVSYSMNGNDVSLGDTANPVTRIITYEASSDRVSLSKATDGIDANVLSMVEKSLDSLSNNNKLKEVLKSKQEKGKQLMEQEIQKAVDAAVGVVKADLLKAQADLTEAMQSLEKANAEKVSLQEKLDNIEKSAKEAKDKQRVEALKGVIADEKQVEALFKAFAPLDDEAFAEVIKSYSDKNEQLENGELFVQKSKTGSDEESESSLSKMLREQYASK